MSYSNRGQHISRTVMLSTAVVAFLLYSLAMLVNSSMVGSSQSIHITKRVGHCCRLYNTHSYNHCMLTVYSSIIEILLQLIQGEGEGHMNEHIWSRRVQQQKECFISVSRSTYSFGVERRIERLLRQIIF